MNFGLLVIAYVFQDVLNATTANEDVMDHVFAGRLFAIAWSVTVA